MGENFILGLYRRLSCRLYLLLSALEFLHLFFLGFYLGLFFSPTIRDFGVRPLALIKRLFL